MFVLREDLYFCVANDRAVFLDLKANRYFCLPPNLDGAFQDAIVPGGLNPSTATCSQLVTLGVLTSSDLGERPLLPPSLAPAQLSVDSLPGKTNLWAMIDALICRRAARRALVSRPLNVLIQQLRLWKTDRPPRDRGLDRHIRADIAAFAKSRRMHVSQDQCLPSSVALLQFLRKRAFYPSFVIGVKMSPFAAHAWVQIGSTVLADDVDKVRLYTPILVV